jgi:hypothetical protein
MLLILKLAAIINQSPVCAVLRMTIVKSLPSETTQKNVDKYPSVANVGNESCSQWSD